MRRLALVPTLIAALLLPAGAYALGLGNIEIQSALNQRLDAEIPLRGVPSGRSDEIEVSLASEEAFRNVGLDRPFALTRLQFAVKQRSGGGYYVHVTSQESIVEPFLSFLVEVDWQGGNLLREYTVLLDPPVFAREDESEGASGGAATDTARTSETSDDAGVTGEIERDTDSSATGAESDAGTEGEGDDAETRTASGSGQSGTAAGEDKPVFLEVEEREERARAEAERAQAAEQAATEGGSTSRSAGVPEQYGPVANGETLWSIASRLKSGDMTTQQMMIALLRYNPDAFAGENINRLKQGYVLRVPDSERVLEVSAQRALATVREQNGVWRELQERSRTETSVAASEQGSGDAGTPREGGTTAGDGELSIVGADEGGASSDEAASATGSSSTDESEKLQLAREQLESTRIEKEELESRVNELEQTVEKMEKLLELRDERLSALQEELRKLEGRQAADGESGTAADEESDREAGAELADEGDADGDATDDEDMMAAADGDAADDEAAGASGAGDGGSGGEETAAAEGGEAGTDATASADNAEAGDGEAQATASADEQGSDEYIPEGKEATDADRGFETTRTQEPQETWLDKVNGVIATVGGVLAGLGGGLLGGPVGLGLAAALVLLGGGLIVMRRRREAAESADDLDGFDPVEPDADIAAFDADSSGSFDARKGHLDEDDESARASGAEDRESALMSEEFDVGSLDEEESSGVGGASSGGGDEMPRGIDDEEAEKDDTVAEADVYLAYGLHQQAEDLLRLALREQGGNAMYHEKLLETLYASGKTEQFIEEAETFRGLVDGPDSRLWQRVLAMGRDLAPRHELFAEGETSYTAADVQPTRPAGTDLELDDGAGDIDFGLDDESGSTANGSSGSTGDQDEDEFNSTVMLDSSDFEAVEGDGGLVGPDDDRAQGAHAGTEGAAATEDEDEDLEFDLGDLESLSGDDNTSAPAAPGAAADDGDDQGDGLDFDLDDDVDETRGAGISRGDADDGALDFDLDFDEPASPDEGLPAGEPADSGPAETPTSAGSGDGEFDFDLDLEESTAGSGATASTSDDSTGAGPVADTEDDALEIGDLEIGDFDSLETGSADGTDADAADSARGADSADSRMAGADDSGGAETETFELSDIDTGSDEGSEESPAGSAAGATGTRPDETAAYDTFDLSDLDASGEAAAEDSQAIDLDNLGAVEGAREPSAAESAPASPSPAGETGGTEAASGAADAGGAADEDDEFDTMLDLARAYIDMGDPESATNALEEVASSGNERQRGEAQSLLENVR